MVAAGTAALLLGRTAARQLWQGGPDEVGHLVNLLWTGLQSQVK
jgi:hypothetical protein